MPTYVALLRGINVGKAKRIPMADLRALLEANGCTDVATLLNSGNAVFEARQAPSGQWAARLSAAVAERFGSAVPVIVKSARELQAIAADNPWAADAPDHSRLLVAFVQDAASLKGLEPIAARVVPPEGFVVGPHAAYLHCVSGILESKAGKALLGPPGQMTTTRNWATLLKLMAWVRARAG
jgi:uncharacterized protein (DUF1697 family)